MSEDQEHNGRPVDRRRLLQMMAAGTSAGVLGSVTSFPAFANENDVALANPRYDKFYRGLSTYFANDPQWVAWTKPRLTWPKEGEVVPELTVQIPTVQTSQIDAWRKWAADGEKIGLKYNIEQVSYARWIQNIGAHKHGDIEMHTSILRAERLDPSEWLVSRAHGLDRFNFGEWVNEEYDDLVEKQAAESDFDKRLKLIQSAQKVLAEDFYIAQLGWGPGLIEAYNSAAWDNLVATRGFGSSSFNAFHGFLRAKPKTSRRKIIVGVNQLLETTNLMAGVNNMRSIGRMIYDRLAYIDTELKVIPWAAESWKRIDERTWDIKLRPGMKFHDGKPVTVEDLKSTFDFLLKWERGPFWTANQFLEKTEIVDSGNGILRTTFKKPYGQFETYFLQINVVLPSHLWQNIMQEQGVGDDARRLRIDKPIGSGPFKFGQYRKEAELQLIADKSHFSKPELDEIWLTVSPSIDALIGRLQSQEIDMIESSDLHLTPSQAKQLEGLPHIKVVHTPDINWLHAVPRVSNLPWRDIEFRRAWQHSFDREFLVKVVWEGSGRVPAANSFLVEGNQWYNPNLPTVPAFDLDKARELLKAAGYSWGANGRLVYPKPSDVAFRKRVQQVSTAGYTWGGLKMLD